METIASVPVIVIICMFASQMYKSFFAETTYKHIPTLCGLLGLALGVICYITLPNYIPAENWLVASAIGLVSGLTATGTHQIYKQSVDV